MPEITKEQAYTEIVEWLYLNDKQFPDKMDWRKAFTAKLKETLNNIK